MAEIKKYLDTTALGHLVDNIKAEDVKVLDSAKAYADGLASNYDVAGAAATAKSEAIAAAKTETETQVNALANGAVKANTDAITAIKDGASIDSFADVEAALAGKQATGDYATKAEAQGYADAKDAAIAAAKAAGDAAQADVNELAELVGELPEGTTATSVVDYVNVKTAGIATDAALGELQSQLSGVQGEVATIKGDYLKKADKDELAGNIAAVKEDVDAFLDAAEVGDAAVDTLKEIQAYITSDGEAAATMTANIAANAEAIEALQTADGEQDEKIAALEAKFGGADGSVEDMIADAKAEAIEAAGTAADTKDAEILAQAKSYADTEDAKIEARVDALEAIDHEHSNLALLETYTQTEANLADAVAKKHEHSNLVTLETITAELIGKWNAAEQNAKDYADGLNTTMGSRVDGAVERISALETASATHAKQTDLEAAVTRIAANEAAIAANTSAINSFSAITEAEVDALFA